MKVVYYSAPIRLFLSKASGNFKAYAHVTMLCKFFKKELGMAEVISLANSGCFNIDHIFVQGTCCYLDRLIAQDIFHHNKQNHKKKIRNFH